MAIKADLMFDPLELLEGFLDEVNNDRISFIEGTSKDKIKQILKNRKKNDSLIKVFEEGTRRLKEARTIKDPSSTEEIRYQLSDFLDSHLVHKFGQELWKELMSAAIKNIESNAKGNSKLYKYLGAATKFEDLLYGLENYYRDHTLHSLWVYFIGIELMKKGGALATTAEKDLNWYLFNDIEEEKDNYPYPDYLVEWSVFRKKYFHLYNQKYRDAVWCIIALSHDLGYSLAKLDKLNKKVQDVLEHFHVSNFRHIGYSLDIDHQYLVKQFLELMAMDVRIVPGEGYKYLDDTIKNKIIGRKNTDVEDKKSTEEIKEIQDEEFEKIKQFCKSIEDKYSDPEKVPDKMDLWEGCEESLFIDIAKAVEEETLVKCYRDDSTYWRLCKAFERKEHGVLSAYLLYKTLGIFADTYVRGSAEEWGLSDEEVKYNVIRGDILFAIAQHEFAYAHLDQLGGLAEILIICDELEEFTRLGRQLQSRKYHDTAAKTGFEVCRSKNQQQENVTVVGDWIDIKLYYDSEHEEEDDFDKFFARKSERLCKLFSLDQKRDKNEVLFNPINSIKTYFSWYPTPDAGKPAKKLSFEINKTTPSAGLYKSKYNCTIKGCNTKNCPIRSKSRDIREVDVQCMDDNIVIKTKCTNVITLRDWLDIDEDE